MFTGIDNVIDYSSGSIYMGFVDSFSSVVDVISDILTNPYFLGIILVCLVLVLLPSND